MTSIRNLQKQINKGKIRPVEPDRLTRLRHQKDAQKAIPDDMDDIDWDEMAEKRLGQS